jgi:hypothetical protein
MIAADLVDVDAAPLPEEVDDAAVGPDGVLVADAEPEEEVVVVEFIEAVEFRAAQILAGIAPKAVVFHHALAFLL